MDSKLDDDTNLIACQRVAGRPPEVPSVIRQCARCKQDIYLSHATQARIEKEGEGKPVVFSCLECLPTFDINLGDTLRPSAEQLREIEENTGRKISEADIALGMERFKTMYRQGRSDRN